MNALQAASDPRRQQILQLVWRRERSAGEIHRMVGGITFGAVSQHLRVLSDAGLVRGRRAGRMRYYEAARETMGPLREVLEAMWDDKLAKLKQLAENEASRHRKG